MPAILVIEDDNRAREALAIILRYGGYRVAEAANGLQALEWLKATERLPDLILLDLMMPVMDGWQFHRALTRERAWLRIPVVLCTACGDGPVHADALGTAGCIDKPVDPEELFALL